MILILTYHKVLPGLDHESGFYSIQAEQLERQLELLAQSGLHALSPEELVENGPAASRAYFLSFDDGTTDHYKIVLPMLARYGCRGVFFVPTAWLDRPGFLSSKQVIELSQAGQTIGLHSHEHRRLDQLGEKEIRMQMDASRQIIGDLTGKPPLFFAPVGGYMNRTVRRMALESGIRVIRTLEWGYNHEFDGAALQSIPVNRHCTERKFRQLLEFRRRSTMLYAAKEITKKMIPGRAYKSLRRFVFEHSAEKWAAWRRTRD
ncbi:MAG TPA: polysaccharide deacetylase family protein [Candidatus Paceibacterota bacterium]|nr:polysaccharide deacetylase family protein [Candidatus Hydrogenedentota bacterium]HRT59096.1 polysaccharide deacetylase family protein [Candidatus Paceibacterota bacterium]